MVMFWSVAVTPGFTMNTGPPPPPDTIVLVAPCPWIVRSFEIVMPASVCKASKTLMLSAALAAAMAATMVG